MKQLGKSTQNEQYKPCPLLFPSCGKPLGVQKSSEYGSMWARWQLLSAGQSWISTARRLRQAVAEITHQAQRQQNHHQENRASAIEHCVSRTSEQQTFASFRVHLFVVGWADQMILQTVPENKADWMKYNYFIVEYALDRQTPQRSLHRYPIDRQSGI
jgi:hypothetical protein